MPKSYSVYKDKQIKRFDKVTVVYGESKLKKATREDIIHFDSAISHANCVLFSWQGFETKGVAKCSPEDEYNEKTGLIVASRKAELKAVKKHLRDVDNAIKVAEEYLAYLRDMEDKLDYKVVKLSVDLAATNRDK